jgi:hypothetical protein
MDDVAKRKLALLIPLLASDKDGEVIAAVTAIRKTLAGTGSDLHELARAISAPTQIVYKTVFREAERPAGEWAAKANYCNAARDALAPKEREFVADMAVRLQHMREPTEKQAAWLDAIFHRLKRQEAARA